MRNLILSFALVAMAAACGCSSFGAGAGVREGEARAEAERHFRLALEYRSKGEQEPARREFERALRADSNHRRAREALGYERVGDRWLRKSDIVRVEAINLDRRNILQVRARGKLLGKIFPGARREFVLAPGKLELEIRIDEAVGTDGKIISTVAHSSTPLPIRLKGERKYQLTISTSEPGFAVALGRGSWTKLVANEIARLSFSGSKCMQVVTSGMVPICSPTGEPLEIDYRAQAPRWLAASGIVERVPNKGMRFPDGLVLPREVQASVGPEEHAVFATEKGIYKEYPWIKITRFPGGWLYLEEGKQLVEGKGKCPYSERRKPPHIPAGSYLRSGTLYLNFNDSATIAGIKGNRGTEIVITPTEGRLNKGSAFITAYKPTDVGSFIVAKGTSFEVRPLHRPAGQPVTEARIIEGQVIPRHLPFIWRGKGYAVSIKGKERFYYQTDLGWVLVREL